MERDLIGQRQLYYREWDFCRKNNKWGSLAKNIMYSRVSNIRFFLRIVFIRIVGWNFALRTMELLFRIIEF